MIEKMSQMRTEFQGDGSRVRCFAHIVNLVAKSVITQFDLPKKKTNSFQDHENIHKRTAADDDELDEDGYEVLGWGEDGNVADIDAILTGGDPALMAKLANIRRLAGSLDDEQQRQREEEAPEEHVNDEEDDGWIDERWSMDDDELKGLAAEVMPARQMLVKVG
jgi:hypothetical protein